MRCLERNKSVFYYANAVLSSEIVNSDGNLTGRYQITYSEPVLSKMNIGTDSGVIEPTERGLVKKYDRVIVTDDLSCDIKENSKVWIDSTPQTEDANYLVKRISKSINFISIGLQRVR